MTKQRPSRCGGKGVGYQGLTRCYCKVGVCPHRGGHIPNGCYRIGGDCPAQMPSKWVEKESL